MLNEQPTPAFLYESPVFSYTTEKRGDTVKLLCLLLITLGTISSSTIASPIHQRLTIIIEVDDPHEQKQWIETYYPTIEVLEVFDTLFNGLAIQGKKRPFEQLLQQDFIKKTYPIQTYQTPAELTGDHQQTLEPSSAWVTDNEELLNTYTGAGIKIGVIDTGIDYQHPDLVENFSGGYDLVDLDDDPMETQANQGPPTIHGTHVAGVIAANGEMTGIAPDAELYGYRALGPGGTGTTIQVIAALEKAVKDEVDIINMSLGNAVNGPDWPTSVAVNRAVEKGIVVVIANGNAGPDDWTVGSPATATNAIAVGASTNQLSKPVLEDNFLKKEIELTPVLGASEWDLDQTYAVIDGGLGNEPINNASDKIALFERGQVTFTEKVREAEAAGARAVLIYNDGPDEIQVGLEEETVLPVATITQADGNWLVNQVKQENYWINATWKTMENQIANFSSRGPVTVNWEIKPEIVAPGVNILSTVPNGYQALQGTSMSAPYVTGALALLKEAHPTWTPAQLKGALLTQAAPLTNQEPIEQGMGEIRIAAAIDTPIIIENPLLSFGKVEERRARQKKYLEIENVSQQPQRFSFSLPKQMRGVRWHFPAAFSLAIGERVQVPIELEITSDWLAEGIHQGYLNVTNGDKDYQLPYLFVNQTAEYPKAMGFELELEPLTATNYTYRLYLPEPVETLTIDLYDPDTFAHVETIVERTETEVGILEGGFSAKHMEARASYLVNISIINQGEVTDYQHMYTSFP